MMAEINDQYAYFSATGEFDPAGITSCLGTQPTDCWHRGDSCPRTNRERQFSRWCLHSRLDRSCELEAHIRDVLAQLGNNPEAFELVSHELGGVMQLVSYFRLSYPGLHFDRNIIKELSRYSLEVDFDFYWLYAPCSEDADAELHDATGSGQGSGHSTS